MTILYIATYDCAGRINLVREDFAGDVYPKDSSKITRRTLLSDGRALNVRRQESQWHDKSDEDAIAKARRLANEYRRVEG